MSSLGLKRISFKNMRGRPFLPYEKKKKRGIHQRGTVSRSRSTERPLPLKRDEKEALFGMI